MRRFLLDLWLDVVYALRVLGNSPGFTTVGILSLTLGIGVCCVFYSEMNSLVFRSLPAVRNPEALVAMEGLSPYRYFERYREQKTVTAAATAFVGPVPFSLAPSAAAGAKTARVFGHLVSPEYFTTLGVEPAMGRFFRPDLEKEGTAPVAVVSERLWRTRLNADRNVVGRTLRLNGKSVTVIGVAPKNFLGVFPIAPADVFLPVTSGALVAPELGNDALHRWDLAMFRYVGRLAPGVSRATAEAALDSVKRHLDDEAGVPESERKGRQVRLLSASGIMPMPAEQRAMTFTFMAVLMSLILSLACTNLANLLLARGGQRRKELAIRIALGANRFRLMRQLLTESVLLALAGGAGSFLFTYWMTSLISSIRMPAPVVFEFDIKPDFSVFLVTLLLSTIVGIAFGLVPALSATRADVTPSLKEGGLSRLRGYRWFGFRNLLVAYQVASSLMLLLIVGYLVLGYRRTSHIDPGFETASLYLLELDPEHDGYTNEQATRLLDILPDRLARLSAVSAVTLAEAAPFADMAARPNARFSTPQPKGDVQVGVIRQRIGASYFATLGVPLEQGREFTREDLRAPGGPNAGQAALVNQTAARELFGTLEALGRRIRDVPSSKNYTVVGVTRDLKPGFFSSEPLPTVFVPLALNVPASATSDVFGALNRSSAASSPGATIVVRGPSGVDAIASVRAELAAIDPNLTVFNTRTMSEQLSQMNALIQLGSTFYGGIGVFGLILACVGLAGVTAYAVARRTKEIGIRMALGATPGQVLRLVMREGAILVLVGTALGFAGAVVVSRALASMTAELARAFGASAGDPLLLAGVPLLLGGLAILACYLPARKATKVDPLAALRQE
ncbi:MAG: ADOP family duplicated permease [Candidatus Solibacter sp.]